MDSAKKRIVHTVGLYIKYDLGEYQMLMDALRMRRQMIEDGVEATEGADMMPMYEMSEHLQAMLIKALSSDEQTWWKSREGGRWFIKRFPQFSLQ